jgi:GNAT superfamily N-acetyltransferase
VTAWREVAGWEPGVIGGVAALHARHHAASRGFGAFFETKVATELGPFLQREPRAPGDFFRAALGPEGEVLGSIAMDGADTPGAAHLRWFILDAQLRGQGIGRRWLGEALAAARAGGFARCTLWTLDGLDDAARLYASAGFVTAERVEATQWGRAVVELRMEAALGGP